MKHYKNVEKVLVVLLCFILLLSACGKGPSGKTDDIAKEPTSNVNRTDDTTHTQSKEQAINPLDLAEAPAEDFEYFVKEGTGVYILKYIGNDTQVRIPATIEDEPITQIGREAFQKADITYLYIPDTVIEIGNYAFSDCRDLETVIIPDSVTTLEIGAFTGCVSLINVTIPSGITEIRGVYVNSKSRPYGVFSGCARLKNIEIPDGVTKLGYGAFSECKSLTSIIIPDSVTEIDKYAFANCSSLTEITIPDGVAKIEWETFAYCSNLEKVHIPDSVVAIDKKAFIKCAALDDGTKAKILKINPECEF